MVDHAARFAPQAGTAPPGAPFSELGDDPQHPLFHPARLLTQAARHVTIPGQREVDVARRGRLGHPEPHVVVLGSLKTGIELADPLEYRPPDQDGGGDEDVPDRQPLPRHRHESLRAQFPRPLGSRSFRPGVCAGPKQAEVGSSVEKRKLEFEFAGMPHVIGVQKCDELGTGFAQAPVAGRGHTLVRLMDIVNI